MIGIRGMPRVEKKKQNQLWLQVFVQAKRWLFVSSTLLKQTIRSQLIADEYSPDNVFIIDGIVSTRRGSEKHLQLLREIMRLPATKVVEHPDIFIQNSEYTMDDFDYIIELRNSADEEITYEHAEEPQVFDHSGFSGFDFLIW
ncbi:hypothetical protein BsIDN1_31380 [Bacillus safensis]|uniref:DUF3388 domain-containing protein n=1 Tax=Bacillus safensis TaxID=561879 RepID=A0A5S9M7I9_BACIA|nr:hypothetical protein BsIDN1_31380 [Bacillus safensis]